MPAQETTRAFDEPDAEVEAPAKRPAPVSSHFEAGNDGGPLWRPTSRRPGREHPHLRPVVWELATAIEANNVSPGDGRCSCAAPQLAADGDGEAAPFVPTAEDDVEQTHRALLD